MFIILCILILPIVTLSELLKMNKWTNKRLTRSRQAFLFCRSRSYTGSGFFVFRFKAVLRRFLCVGILIPQYHKNALQAILTALWAIRANSATGAGISSRGTGARSEKPKATRSKLRGSLFFHPYIIPHPHQSRQSRESWQSLESRKSQKLPKSKVD